MYSTAENKDFDYGFSFYYNLILKIVSGYEMQWIHGFSKGPQMHCRYTFVTNRPFSLRNNHARTYADG